MAKEEECRQCTKCKIGSYGSLKCSFYGRQPEFNDSSCQKFTQRDTPIGVKQVKYVAEESPKEVKQELLVNEQVEPDGQVCYHGSFAGDVYPVEDKPQKVKKEKSLTGPLFIGFIMTILLNILNTSKYLTTAGVIFFSLSFFVFIVYFAYIFVFYRMWKKAKPNREQLQPLYRSLIKINTGTILDRLVLFQSFFFIFLVVRIVIMMDAFLSSSSLISFLNSYEEGNSLEIIFVVIYALLVFNLISFSVRLFQLKHKSFATKILIATFLLLAIQIVPQVAESLFVFFGVFTIFDMCAIFGADILLEEAKKTFVTNNDSEIDEKIE